MRETDTYLTKYYKATCNHSFGSITFRGFCYPNNLFDNIPSVLYIYLIFSETVCIVAFLDFKTTFWGFCFKSFQKSSCTFCLRCDVQGLWLSGIGQRFSFNYDIFEWKWKGYLCLRKFLGNDYSLCLCYTRNISFPSLQQS